MTEEQMRAYVIADNRLAELSGWDEAILRMELEELHELDFDITLTGFDLDFLEEEEFDESEDEVEELSDITSSVSRYGDVWLIGGHRVMCGDSTSSEDVNTLMSGETSSMVFTDPPYDFEDNSVYIESIDEATKDAHIFVMHDDRGIVDYLRSSKLDFKRFFVCNFGFSSPRGNDPYLQHILISHETKGDAIPHQNHYDGFSSIIKMEYRHRLKDDETEHKHQKPLGMIRQFIKHYSKENDIILDLFGGSGSTLMSSEQSGRRCYTMEFTPAFVDGILSRFEKLFDTTAVLEQTGESFESVKERREAE